MTGRFVSLHKVNSTCVHWGQISSGTNKDQMMYSMVVELNMMTSGVVLKIETGDVERNIRSGVDQSAGIFAVFRKCKMLELSRD